MNQLKTILLLGALSSLLLLAGRALGPGHMPLFLGIALLMNLGAYFFSDKIVLAMQRATAVTPEQAPRLHRIVDELSQRAGIPKPRVYVVPQPHANAFATGRNPANSAVAVTQGLLDLLDERELRGVIAHELAHVQNRDILVASIAAAVATAVTYLAQAAQWAAILGSSRDRDEEGGSPLGGLVFAFLAPVAATLIQLAISRSREFLADESGARMSGDPEALARALEKLHTRSAYVPAAVQPATASLFIVSPFGGSRSVLSWFSTHPPVEERVTRLRAMR